MAMVVMGDTCVQSITAIRTTMLVIVPKAICCCHGDGSESIMATTTAC